MSRAHRRAVLRRARERAGRRTRRPRVTLRCCAKLRAVGIGPGLHPSARASEQRGSGRPARSRAGRARRTSSPCAPSFAAKSVVAHNGWFVPPPINGAYGTNYAYRPWSRTTASPPTCPAEALYIVGAASPARACSTGGHDYVIHFAAGHLPPARYFWSLTMYDKNFYLVPNAAESLRAGQRHPGPEAQSPTGRWTSTSRTRGPPGTSPTGCRPRRGHLRDHHASVRAASRTRCGGHTSTRPSPRRADPVSRGGATGPLSRSR